MHCRAASAGAAGGPAERPGPQHQVLPVRPFPLPGSVWTIAWGFRDLWAKWAVPNPQGTLSGSLSIQKYQMTPTCRTWETISHSQTHSQVQPQRETRGETARGILLVLRPHDLWDQQHPHRSWSTRSSHPQNHPTALQMMPSGTRRRNSTIFACFLSLT